MASTGATSWNTCNVFGTWHNQDGTNKSGSYTVTIPNRVCNITDDVIIPAGTFATGELVTTLAQKSFSLDLPANDDPDNSPVDWGRVKIEIRFNGGGAAETYVIDTPVGGSINLRTVILPTTVPTQAPFLLLGVAGGAAQLSADGQSVLSSDGVPIVTGTGGGGTSSVTSADITDATTTGRSVLTAATAAAARTAIGAGTSSLALGTTSTTALAGNTALFSGSYTDLTSKPTLFSGSYTDLTNKPALFSGAYADLTGKPTLGTAAAANTTAFATAAQGAKADTAVQPAALAAKADLASGHVPVTQATTATVLHVAYTGTAWPARPTARTDISVFYMALTAADPAPTDFVAGVDYLIKPAT